MGTNPFKDGICSINQFTKQPEPHLWSCVTVQDVETSHFYNVERCTRCGRERPPQVLEKKEPEVGIENL